MTYCDACGEPIEGRFCRMCGAPTKSAVSPVAGQAFAPVQGSLAQAPAPASFAQRRTYQSQAAPGFDQTGIAPTRYSPASSSVSRSPAQQYPQSRHEASDQQATQFVPAAPYGQDQQATQFVPASPFEQSGQPTQYLPAASAQARQGVFPASPNPVDPRFEGLFRGASGSAGDDGHTRVLSPVDADLPAARQSPYGPDASSLPYGSPGVAEPAYSDPAYPYGGGPGGGGPGDGGWSGDDGPPRNQKAMIWGTGAAVGVVVLIILALLYIGRGSGQGSPAASASDGATATASASASQSVDSVVLPSASASPSPSASASPSPSPSAAQQNSSLPLSLGSTGSLVTYVQQRLSQLGYYNGAISGTFDGPTAQAVVQFQGAAQVSGDPAGTVGAATLTAIVAAGTTPRLGPGHGQASDIERLQEALNVAENAGLTVTGKYDQQTMVAVGRYQSAVGLPVTGLMDAQTWQALQRGRLGS